MQCGIIGPREGHCSRMNQTAKIRIEGSNYPIVRFFMWVGLASFAVMFMALWLSEFTLAAVGFTLLLIARVAGDYFHRKGSGSQDGLRYKKCGQQQALSTAPPTDRVARCHYCGGAIWRIFKLTQSRAAGYSRGLFQSDQSLEFALAQYGYTQFLRLLVLRPRISPHNHIMCLLAHRP